MNKISVLYIANDASLYGANSSLINLIHSLGNLERNNYPISYHVIIPYQGPIEVKLKENNIPYSVILFRADSDLWDNTFYAYISYLPKFIYKLLLDIFAIRKLKKIIINKKINIVHSNSSVIGIGFRVSQLCRIKHVWHLRELQDKGLNLRPFRGWKRLIRQIDQSDAVIAVSNLIAKHYKVEKNLHVLFNAVLSTKKQLCILEKEKYFLFCGSLSPNKGVHVAISAFAEFHKKHPDYSFCIAGTATPVYHKYEAKLKKMVADFNLNQYVSFLGFREDTDVLMNKAMALLMCSKNEGMGRVTAEAMLNNCLVIGYDDAGTKELIHNGETGFLFRDEDELEALMSKVARKKINSDDIQQKAFNFAKKHFLEETYGEKIWCIYDNILNLAKEHSNCLSNG